MSDQFHAKRDTCSIIMRYEVVLLALHKQPFITLTSKEFVENVNILVIFDT